MGVSDLTLIRSERLSPGETGAPTKLPPTTFPPLTGSDVIMPGGVTEVAPPDVDDAGVRGGKHPPGDKGAPDEVTAPDPTPICNPAPRLSRDAAD